MVHCVRYTALFDTFNRHYVRNTQGKGSREPPLGLVFFRLADFPVPLFPKVLKEFIDAVDITHSCLPPGPIDYDRPLERIEVMLRLGEDLVGGGRRTACDKTRQAAVLQVGFDRSELVLGGKSGDNFKVEVKGAFGVTWGIRAANGRAKELESSIGIGHPFTMEDGYLRLTNSVSNLS